MHRTYKKNFTDGRLLLAIALAGLVFLGECAAENVKNQPIARSKADPYERVNRKIFQFNDTVDEYLAEPIANAYKAITPQFVRTGIFNFYNNLETANTIVNAFLQGKPRQGLDNTGRLLVNSTLGLAGFVDVAKYLNLEHNDEDFDQTLALWGLPSGPYLVLPFLGPTTVRGIPGILFDTAANPTSYVGIPVQLLYLLNARANAQGALQFIDEAALDRYLFTRESFLQWRQNLASDGQFASLDYFEEFAEADTANAAGFPGSVETFNTASNAFTGATAAFDKTALHFRTVLAKLSGSQKQ